MGSTLKELKIENFYYNQQQNNNNVVKIIAYFCPNLECIEFLETMDIKIETLKNLSKSCKKIKSIICNCNNIFFNKILMNFPNLERISITGYNITMQNFNKLPQSLKILDFVSYYYESVSINNNELKFIGNNCTKLRVLNLYNICISKEILEYIAKQCLLLKELTLGISFLNKEGLLFYNNLKLLELYLTEHFDFSTVIEHMKILENLIVTRYNSFIITQKIKINFNKFKYLKNVNLYNININSESLIYLRNSNIKYFYLKPDM